MPGQIDRQRNGLGGPPLGWAAMPEQQKGTNWRAWIVGVLIALVVIVCLQNSQQVRVDVLFVTLDAPLIVTLLVAVAIGALIGYVAPLVRRHRREESKRT
jgi:uncharacterized integral membrane protein